MTLIILAKLGFTLDSLYNDKMMSNNLPFAKSSPPKIEGSYDRKNSQYRHYRACRSW